MPRGKQPRKSLGSCPFCGEELIATKHGWGCSNFKGGCKAFIFKNDHFFEKVLGRKPTQDQALTLIMGGTVSINGVVIKGRESNIKLTWGKKEGGPYPFGYDIEFC